MSNQPNIIYSPRPGMPDMPNQPPEVHLRASNALETINLNALHETHPELMHGMDGKNVNHIRIQLLGLPRITDIEQARPAIEAFKKALEEIQ